MSPRVNLTYPTAMVLQALATGYHYGFDILDVTDLPSGTVYPILRRLDQEGLVKSKWEKAAVAHRENRPPRRYYEITGVGQKTLAEALTRFRAVEKAVPPAAQRLKPARAKS
jgi:DNA-binding PadR family transcriptional regulator